MNLEERKKQILQWHSAGRTKES